MTPDSADPATDPRTDLPPGPLPTATRYRSKTIAAWLALLGGALGLHRLYLYGLRDMLAWLHWVPTLTGWIGLQRLLQLGQDDQLAWLLLPVLGLMLSMGALFAILYGLKPDERWDAHYNPGLPPRNTTWGPVMAAIMALLLGGGILMATITYSVQMFFQWELDKAAISLPATGGQSVLVGSLTKT